MEKSHERNPKFWIFLVLAMVFDLAAYGTASVFIFGINTFGLAALEWLGAAFTLEMIASFFFHLKNRMIYSKYDKV